MVLDQWDQADQLAALDRLDREDRLALLARRDPMVTLEQLEIQAVSGQLVRRAAWAPLEVQVGLVPQVK